MSYIKDLLASATEILKDNPKLAKTLLLIVTVLLAGVVAKTTNLPISELVSAIWSILESL